MATRQFSHRPLYLQLRDALAERIATGAWKVGMAISSEGDLAREFGVSQGTMRKALDLMEHERLITRRQGRGTFVNDQSSDELALRYTNIRTPNGDRLIGDVRSPQITDGVANEMECARLCLPTGDRVLSHPTGSSERRRTVHGRGSLRASHTISWAGGNERALRIASFALRRSTASCSATRGTYLCQNRLPERRASLERPQRCARCCAGSCSTVYRRTARRVAHWVVPSQ